jgi:NRAMP (natural resistance-associated macrophage protein)-like metal ion transporter
MPTNIVPSPQPERSPSGPLENKPVYGVRRFLRALGPGLITGAADDDPSGIATYSVTGAQLGTGMLWTAFVTWPLMGAVQMMCARVGMVTGGGLASALKKKFPRPLLILAGIALFVANTINIGADLAGMADAAEDLTHVNSKYFVVIFGIVIAVATVKFSYPRLANVLKWLVLALFTYVIAAFLVHPDWPTVWHDVIHPPWPRGHDAWSNVVAILGTTISPYLFFWQASLEVEEEKAKGRRKLAARIGATSDEIIDRKVDVGVGTFFSNLIMFFIMLCCAMTLHKNGTTNVESARDAAEALRPAAGLYATGLYTLGIIGVGFLAIPTLAGSAAYAFAETFRWRQGLDEKYGRAREFYGVVIISTLAGIALDFTGINPVKALFLTSVLNGILAPFLMLGLLVVACDRKIMCDQPSSLLSRIVVGITILTMSAAAVAMFVV